MRLLKILGLCAFLLCSNAMAVTSASSLKLQVFSVMLSTSPLCSSPTTVFSNTSPTEVDFLASPTLGGGNPADGTYYCVIIEMQDSIKFKPSSSEGTCTVNVEYADNVCQASEQTNAPDSSTMRACTSGTDRVFLYITTNKQGGGGGHAFEQPNGDQTKGVQLTTPLVVSPSTARSKFVVNVNGRVDGLNSTCGMNAPVFDFRALP